MGDSMLITNTSIFISVKLMTMAICFAFFIFIAPFRLLYLYFQISKLEKNQMIILKIILSKNIDLFFTLKIDKLYTKYYT